MVEIVTYYFVVVFFYLECGRKWEKLIHLKFAYCFLILYVVVISFFYKSIHNVLFVIIFRLENIMLPQDDYYQWMII